MVRGALIEALQFTAVSVHCVLCVTLCVQSGHGWGALSEALLQSVFIVYCVGCCVYSHDMVMGH